MHVCAWVNELFAVNSGGAVRWVVTAASICIATLKIDGAATKLLTCSGTAGNCIISKTFSLAIVLPPCSTLCLADAAEHIVSTWFTVRVLRLNANQFCPPAERCRTSITCFECAAHWSPPCTFVCDAKAKVRILISIDLRLAYDLSVLHRISTTGNVEYALRGHRS